MRGLLWGVIRGDTRSLDYWSFDIKGLRFRGSGAYGLDVQGLWVRVWGLGFILSGSRCLGFGLGFGF